MSELSLFKPLEWAGNTLQNRMVLAPVSYTHLRAHET